MATQYYWIGSTGPFKYDDAEPVNDVGDLFGGGTPPMQAPIVSTGQLTIKEAAAATTDVLRYGDLAAGDYVKGPTPATSQTGGIVGWADTSGRLVGASAVLVDIAGSLQIPTGQEIRTGRIKFPASPNSSSDVNTLDDYEEGTWTPVIKFGGTAVSTYSTQAGFYIKIGGVVTAGFRATVTNLGSGTGDISITGLPFTVGTSSGKEAPAAITVDAGITYSGMLMAFAGTYGVSIYLGEYTEAGASNPTSDSECSATMDLAMQLVYEV